MCMSSATGALHVLEICAIEDVRPMCRVGRSARYTVSLVWGGVHTQAAQIKRSACESFSSAQFRFLSVVLFFFVSALVIMNIPSTICKCTCRCECECKPARSEKRKKWKTRCWKTDYSYSRALWVNEFPVTVTVVPPRWINTVLQLQSCFRGELIRYYSYRRVFLKNMQYLLREW